MRKNLAEAAFSNFIWRLLERFGASGVTFVVSIILARMIDPNAYGLIAIVTVIISFVQVFVDGGLGSALVQKKDSDNLDFSSVFFFNIFFSCILYTLIFFVAPVIAKFYENDQLCSVIRILCVIVIISAVKNIQQAYVTKYLIFKRFFFATLGGTVCAAMVGIYMAYKGYGIWALVFQNIINQTVDTVILWITVKWRPSLEFSWNRLRSLLSYGIKIFGANLIASIYNDTRQLAIGKVYTTADLAYYNQGYKYPSFLMNNVNSSIDSVLFPVMVQAQGSKNTVKSITKKSMLVESYVLFPLLVGIGACAPQLIPVLIGEKWETSISYLQIFCIALLLNSLHTPHFNALKSIGRSDLIFKVEFFKKALDFIIMIITLMYSVFVVAIGVIAEGVISYTSTAWVNGKTIDYPFSEQFIDIAPSLSMSLLMGVIVYMENNLMFGNALVLAIQVLTGIAVYLLMSLIFRPKAVLYVKQFASRIIGLKKQIL